MTVTRKKLIEVALPLEAINVASVREGYIYRGNPSALHKWWAQRPLAAARAVIFAQMVDDPSEYVDTLRQDANLRRRAQSVLKARQGLWAAAKELHDKLIGTGAEAPEPGPAPTLDLTLADIERDRLFKIIEQLVSWENTANEHVLQAAREEIWSSWRRACLDNVGNPEAVGLFDRHKLPAFHDPFAGGGTLPLEAQRLGLMAYASDLNPVAVLINKAMIELPPKFADRPPVHPDLENEPGLIQREWIGTQGLAEDVRHYGHWMRDQADKRIGRLYPKAEITLDMARGRPDLTKYVGQKLTVVAWIWARTVKSPNPAFATVDVPLASTFMLSTKAGKEAYVEASIERDAYRLEVKVGKPANASGAKKGTKSGGSGSSFLCLMSGTPMPFEYLRAEAKAGRMGSRLMAIVAEGDRGRVYLSPTEEMEAIAYSATPSDVPETTLPAKALGFRVQEYGMTKWRDLFTSRQLVALTTFSDLIQDVRRKIERDASVSELVGVNGPLREGGTGAEAYAEAVAMYLAMAIDKTAEYGCTIVPWYSKEDRPKGLFARQAIPMVWDYAEVNPLCDIGGSLFASIGIVAGALAGCAPNGPAPVVAQLDAVRTRFAEGAIVSTDPPYYDNIGYADLSDFFYVWLRRSLKASFPDLFATLAVPKAEELVATPFRHGSREKAETFFLGGMTKAMSTLAGQAHPAFPVTIYYAFKQSETDSEDGTTNTGWDTFLAAVIEAGFAISGTWPMRTERGARAIGIGANALASSIILVCRKRVTDAPAVGRREFAAALKAELPVALGHLQRGSIAPVDLAQAAIGPGMAVFTRYSKVLDTQGGALTVREALSLINQTLDDALAEQEGDFDPDTRWALTWFDQIGFAAGDYGTAEQLSTSKNTSVAGMVEAGIIESRPGKVRLLTPKELPANWDPATDARLTAWEVAHHLIRALDAGGESAAAALVAELGAKAQVARELAYRLYGISERKKRAQDAIAYNGLVQSWPEILRLASAERSPEAEQGELLG